MTTDLLVYLVFGALLVFAVYRRVRGSFVRQLVRPRVLWARISLLTGIGALLVASLPTLAGFGAALAGTVTGVVLSQIGLCQTVFERTDQGLFFTPSKWIGGAVTALFLGRLAVRLVTAVELARAAAASGEPLTGLHRSALTLAFFFLFAGYYVGSYAGVLRRVRRSEP